jgi:3-deoxy-D-manno-octulosonic-acid transferase
LSDRTYSRLSQSKIARTFLLPKGLEILTTSERQKARWLELGMDESHLHITGNLKVDSALYQKVCPAQKNALKNEFGFLSESLVLAGISTWPGEESLLIETVLELGNAGLDARLILVPRHAERRSEITKILEKSGLPFHLRSHGKQAPTGTIVYLADTTGELAQLIHSADIGWMGKTLPPNRGGQNPIEPISIGLPLVIGPNYQNFQETCTDLLVHEALAETSTEEEGMRKLLDLAKSSTQREKLSMNAHSWRKKQGSPTALSLARIYQALEMNQE